VTAVPPSAIVAFAVPPVAILPIAIVNREVAS
jgi:hypothetical protein